MKPTLLTAAFVFFVLTLLALGGAALMLTQTKPTQTDTMKTSDNSVRDTKPRYSKSNYDITRLTPERVKELAKRLTAEEAEIILGKGTERRFCGTLLDNKEEGAYLCRLCSLPLFSSGHKFDSGTGWPSFHSPFDPAHIHEAEDASQGMLRTEITCARCSAHLGHVFNDGPKPTGLRYCLNSASLTFINKADAFPPDAQPVKTETAYFAGGCFWGVEDRFQQVAGVIDAASGYMGGKTDKPTYKQVCSEDTGHAETVRVVFDPARVAYSKLLEYFFKFHDPSQLNRQGPDVGSQYRSAIFAASQDQLDQANAFIAEQQKSPRFNDPARKRTIVTQVLLAKDAGPFHVAEDYHQDYHVKHGGSCALPSE